MNVEDPKNKTFEVCVNGERYRDPVTGQYLGKTDEEIELKEMFIQALENAVVDTMIPDPSKVVKLGEVYRIPKKEYRYRVVRLDGKRQITPPSATTKISTQLDEGIPPVATPKKEFAKPRGNPNWRKHKVQEPVDAETGHQLTEV